MVFIRLDKLRYVGSDQTFSISKHYSSLRISMFYKTEYPYLNIFLVRHQLKYPTAGLNKTGCLK